MFSILLALFASQSFASTLSVDEFLNEVKQGNTGVRGALTSSEGGLERSHEGDITTAFTLYSNLQYTSDQKFPSIPVYVFDEVNSGTYTVGVSKQTTFGLLAKVEYDVYSTNYTNLQVPGFNPATAVIPGGFFNPLYQTAPTVSLSMPLWGGGFGASVQANLELVESQALASSYSNRYQARTTLVNAESTYWQLALDRQTVSVQKLAVDRAEKLYESMSHRAKLRLADESDALQAEAVLKIRKLELQSALDQERVDSLAFNSARNVDSEKVAEDLPILQPDNVQSLQIPARASIRDDVKAAEESQRATIANAAIATERDKPTLNVFGSVAANGRSGDVLTSSSGAAGPFGAGRPTEVVGLNFSFPIDPSATQGAKQGWAHEQAGAELTYQRKLFEQEQSWKDLNDKLVEAKRRLMLNHQIEIVQEEKLAHEKRRLTEGRTTTYQVLSFEEDFLSAQNSRIKAEGEVLSVLTQMKLFGEKL